MYSVKMKGIPPPSCQIHHMGTDHWITSVQDTEDDQASVADPEGFGSNEPPFEPKLFHFQWEFQEKLVKLHKSNPLS